MAEKNSASAEQRFQGMIQEWCAIAKDPNTPTEHRSAVLYLLYRHQKAELVTARSEGFEMIYTYRLNSGEQYQCKVFMPVSV